MHHQPSINPSPRCRRYLERAGAPDGSAKRLGWAAAEYVTGSMWPDAVFPYNGRTGELHRNRAVFCIARWVHERDRWGFWEWNSSCYMGINLLNLLMELGDGAWPPRELWQSPLSEHWCPEDFSEVAVHTERCPEYLVSAAFFPDGGRHRHTAQSMLWMSCLNGRIPVFVNQPATATTRFWAGNAVAPRCFLAGGVMVALFDS